MGKNTKKKNQRTPQKKNTKKKNTNKKNQRTPQKKNTKKKNTKKNNRTPQKKNTRKNNQRTPQKKNTKRKNTKKNNQQKRKRPIGPDALLEEWQKKLQKVSAKPKGETADEQKVRLKAMAKTLTKYHNVKKHVARQKQAQNTKAQKEAQKAKKKQKN